LINKYIPALTNLNGFSHLQIVWWGHLFDHPAQRAVLVSDKPYQTGPDKIGIFATRSPIRPNPVLITNVSVQRIDFEKGLIETPYIDAEDGSPVIDIKPYHQSERVRECSVPDWCRHWPEWDEDAATFDWENEFNF
jgi:tRNA (Thr-GGU) A37 N-methylase